MAERTLDPTANCLSARQFLELAWAKRQRIVVVDDDSIEDFVRHELNVGERPTVVWQPTFETREREEFLSRLEEWEEERRTDALERVARRWLDRSRARRYSRFGTLVAVSETTDLIPRRFGAQAQTVYQANPASAGEYVPVEGFYRETVEERCHEAIGLMMGLGAIRIEAFFDEEALSNLGVDLKGRVLGSGGAAEAHARTESKTRGRVAIELPTNSSFAIPPGLRWFDHEPSWRTMADARLKYGATTYECVVSVHESHGVNSQLMRDLKGAELEVGGSFQHFTHTLISFSAEFGSAAT